MNFRFRFRILCLINLAMLSSAKVCAIVVTPAALDSALGLSPQASIINLSGVSPLSCPQVSMSQTWSGGKLIFSDSPESLGTTGMLYMDTNLTATASGVTNRIFVYHVNSNPSAQMRFSVLIRNNGATAGTLTVPRHAMAGPSSSYAYVGEIAFYRWLTNPPAASTTINAGQTIRLDTGFDTINVSQNDLLHGIWDYTFSQPHTLMVCALGPLDNPVLAGPALPVSPRDTHVRGTFASCDKLYNTASATVINTTNGIQQFPLGGNGDAFITGFDNAVSPAVPVTNGGNYGVFYSMALSLGSGDGRALGFLANPRGGGWCGAFATAPGLLPGGNFLGPEGGGTLADNSQAVFAASFRPVIGIATIIRFMPTGGSSFPLRLMAVPYDAVAPSLGAIGNFTVNPGQTLSFTASATDANTNKHLSFSLPLGPAGASLNPSNGFFQYRLPAFSGNSTNVAQIAVSDDSTPSLTASRSFLISVNPLIPLTLTALTNRSAGFTLQANGPIGPDYILQASTPLLNAGGWTAISTNTPASSPVTLIDMEASIYSNRFYRVLLRP
jgi:hypothetical protein